MPKPEEIAEPTTKRDFRITQELIGEYGFTDGCPACSAQRVDPEARRKHSSACRERFEDLMLRDERRAQTIQSRDIRHGLQPPVEREGEEKANDDQGEKENHPEAEEEVSGDRKRARPEEDVEEQSDERATARARGTRESSTPKLG